MHALAGRRLVLTLAGLVALGAAACGGREAPPVPPPSASSIPDPDLGAFEPDVREQLEAARARVMTLVESGSPEPDALTAALSGLARRYHAYEMVEPALAVYRLAAEREPGSFETRYLLGAARHRAGDLAGAREAYAEAAGIRRDYAPLYLRLGEVALELGDVDAALDRFGRAAALAPGSGAMHEAHGRALAAAGRHDEAVAAFERALELVPGPGVVHYGLATSLRELGREEEARAHLDRFTPGDLPVDDPVFAELGTLLVGSGARLAGAGRAMSRQEWPAAAAIYRELLESDPDLFDARLGLGLALYRMGEIDAAIAEYRAATREQPGNIVARHNLAALLAESGESAEAILHYRRALTIEPGNRDAHVGLARLFEKEGRIDDAVESWDALLAADPRDALAISETTRVLFENGRSDEAIERLQRAVAASPDDGVTRVTLGLARAQTGDIDGAMTEFRDVIARGADDVVLARAELGVARVHVLKQQPAEAERHYRNALEIDPDVVEARYELGELLTATGRFTEALAVLEALLEQRPGDAAVCIRVAELMIRAGREAEARDVLARGAEAAGGSPQLTYALARLLVTSRDRTIRDPARALDLARGLTAVAPMPEALETEARALAFLGRHDEAARRQRELIALLDGRVPPEVLAKLRADGARYARGELPSDP